MHKKDGFTLLETLIYIALFSIIVASVVPAVYVLLDSNARVNEQTIADKEANFIIRKINWALSSDPVIVTPLPSDTGDILAVTKADLPPAENPLIFTYDNSSNDLFLKRGSNATIQLNTAGTRITNMTFTHIAPAGTKPAGVTVAFKLNGREFSTTKYLRQ